MLRCAISSLRSFWEEDKYPRKQTALGFGNPGFMEMTYGRKNLGDKDRGGKDIEGKGLGWKRPGCKRPSGEKT